MTLQTKILVLIGATLVLLAAVLYAGSQFILLDRFASLEKESISQNMERVCNALTKELDNLRNLAGNWEWDDTYDLIESAAPGDLKLNFSKATFSKLRLNLIIFLNSSGQIVYAKSYDLKNNRETPPSGVLTKQISGNRIFSGEPGRDNGVTGVIVLPGHPMLITVRSVFSGEGTVPSRGKIVLGRYLDSLEISRLAGITRLPLTMAELTGGENSPDLSKIPQNSIRVTALNENRIEGSALIKDIYGRPAFILKINLPRTIFDQGKAGINYFVLFFFGVGLIFVAAALVIMDKVILSRLASLYHGVSGIAASSDLSIRLPVTGHDELTNLAGAVNRMMNSLEQSHNELEESKTQLHIAHQQLLDIIEFLPDATFVIDQDKKVVAWNRAIEEMTGVKKEEIIGKGDYAYAIPFYGKQEPIIVDLVGFDFQEISGRYQNIQQKGSTLYAEIFVPTINGKGAFLWVTASPLFDSQGNMAGAIESIRDITERKTAEEQLKYLSSHDPLTGLYNRTHFEAEMHRLEQERFVSVGVIICDVDGLKLVNDTLGHSAGDKLLLAAAEVIRRSFKENDLVARVGGDEFAILLPKINEKEIDNATLRIQNGITKYNETSPELLLSISVGYAIRNKKSADMTEIFEKADNNMYREKLHRHLSTRSAIVQSLMKALGARDFITEGHADRLKILVTNLAKSIGLTERNVHDISLLAQFHDIGKLGVPDRVLFKKGSLTPEEKIEMQRHSEIGRSIAQSAQELYHISDWILKHHEWWNGKGYPFGIKGELIPLECRILAIADAYDAMISDRPYRKAMAQPEAIEELIRCSGTQFDPRLVPKFLQMLQNQKQIS
jgi:diguanylate cyclase (GGDEF)-like protein